MELSELAAYALERYQIQEQHKWADFPGFSVLCHPQTGKWVALLMRQWDTDSGMEIQRCDLKCGQEMLIFTSKPYLSRPLRMKGRNWLGITFDRETERSVVFRLFDQAISKGDKRGFTIVLDPISAPEQTGYQETPLPFAGSTYQPKREALPDQLRQMLRMFAYGRADRERNFYLQGKFMEDYEDDAPWMGMTACYDLTYQDLTARQLRGYFAWRTKVRQGNYSPIEAPAAYLYLYELLNGIGAASAIDALEKMEAFERGFIDAGMGDSQMGKNLRRWKLAFAVLHDLPQEIACGYMEEELLEQDRALNILRAPEQHTDQEVFAALCRFGGKKLAESPVIKWDESRGMHLFCEAWRLARSEYCFQDRDLFTLCFGEMQKRRWYPFSNAVYYERSRPEDRDYVLNPCRSYQRRKGVWWTEAYEKPQFDRKRIQSFLHETDLRLRRYLKTGRYLRESPGSEWAVPYIETAIQEDQQAILEAQRPKIHINLCGLEQIRRDALTTRDSLLTEEERMEPEEECAPAPVTIPGPALPDLPLDALQAQILQILLAGKSAQGMITQNHLMPSIVADGINEALFDEIGDVVILCEDDKLSLMEDYRGDLEELLGGNQG